MWKGGIAEPTERTDFTEREFSALSGSWVAQGGFLRLRGIRPRTDGYRAFDVGKLFGDNLAHSQLA